MWNLGIQKADCIFILKKNLHYKWVCTVQSYVEQGSTVLRRAHHQKSSFYPPLYNWSLCSLSHPLPCRNRLALTHQKYSLRTSCMYTILHTLIYLTESHLTSARHQDKGEGEGDRAEEEERSPGKNKQSQINVSQTRKSIKSQDREWFNWNV